MEKELYPVFLVNVCFSSFAINYILVGAKDKNDLISNFDFKSNRSCIDYYGESDLKECIKRMKTDEYRIVKINNLYTDSPYKILESFAYYE